jgi:hypothetical protein
MQNGLCELQRSKVDSLEQVALAQITVQISEQVPASEIGDNLICELPNQ